MNKILFSGCSWTYGDELTSIESRFSKLISDRLNLVEYNISKPRNSIQKISNDTLEQLYKTNYDVVIFQITTFPRFMLPFNGEMISVTKLPPKSYGIDKYFQYKVFELLSNNILKNTSDRDWFNYHYPYLKNVNEYCKAVNVKIIYTFIDEYCKKTFLRFMPPEELVKYNIFETSLKQICQNNSCTFGKREHPLEDGHVAIANALLEYIQKTPLL
jgi:hypothetical protein